MPDLKIKSELTKIPFRDFSLYLEIIYENRKSARISLAKHKAILRLPFVLSTSQKEKHLDWAQSWIRKRFENDPALKSRYIPKNYATGQIIQLRNCEFVLNITENLNRKTASGQLVTKTIFIELPGGIDLFQKHKICSTIISRIMSSVFLPEIKKRVHELNQIHFKKEIKSVKLKLNVSNWGSCSTNKIINLSSRLLLTPQFITDYIIIHELAHLIHMNHSQKYWSLVESVMPDYQKAEQWLNRYGEQCNW
jgi:predicted metal-dependent hydrolase